MDVRFMVSIKTVLFPFRLSLSHKEPIALRVELANDTKETKLFSMKFLVHKDLSVEKTTIANIYEKKLGEMKPGESKLMYLHIYPKASTRTIDYPGRLIIYEHYNDYEFVNKEYKKNFTIKVEK